MSFSTCFDTSDQSIGPSVSGCRGDFDFTVKFEHIFFSLSPSAVFVVLSLWRVILLARRPVIVDAPLLQLAKLGAVISYTTLELSLLILVGIRSFSMTDLAIASSSLRLAAAACMILLSFFDHGRSPRPSMLLSAYLFFTLLFDVAQVRTYWLASSTRPEIAFTAIFTAALAVKVAIILLEARRKTQGMKWESKEHSPEETSGIYSLGVYFWLNRLFFEGYRKTLQMRDLYALDNNMAAQHLHAHFAHHLDRMGLRGQKYGIVLILARSLVVPLILPIPARIVLIGFTFCQPFFINGLLEYLTRPPTSESNNVGYGFIGASAFIYSGIAISTALYWYFHFRMRAMARACLVTAIYTKATEARLNSGEENEAVTLMSSDIERFNQGVRGMHEFWANLIEVAIASWLLYRQLGAAFTAPIVIVLFCATGISILMRFTADGQKMWMAAIQKRVGLTSSVVANMKNLKISGLASPIGDFVQKLRVDELSASATYRKLILSSATLAFIPMTVSPFVTFAVAQRSLDASRLFTSLSYLLLMTQPLSHLFQSLPQLIAGLTCLGRIQTFLECETREDFRKFSDSRKTEWKKDQTATPPTPIETANTQPAITVEEGSFGWEVDKMILTGLNISVPQASLTMIVGPIASGKSSLCKALLGEIPYSQGQVSLSTRCPRVGFCDQTSFLSNDSIKHNIVGFSPFDAARYAEVIDATMLDIDFRTLPQADDTNIGSNGITLSGGQKQRVSLARTLYLQTDLLILDDVFSGLDADTEDQVFQRVFGQDSILRRRRATVVLCTHSVRHLPTAEHIIALGTDGTVVEQGTFEDLVSNQRYIHSLGVRSSSSSDTSKENVELRSKVVVQPSLPRKVTTETVLSDTENKARQEGDRTVYAIYFKSMGQLLAGTLFIFGASYGFFSNFPTIWLKYWSDDAVAVNPSHTFGYYIGIYTLLQMGALLSLMSLGTLLFVTAIRRSGVSLHQDALKTLIHAPLRFFTVIDQGVITNLFSQDLNLIDTELPNALLNSIFAMAVAIGQAAVLITSSPYLAISYPFLIALLFGIQKFYLRTSRQLRLLDLEAKSPLYTHFLDTTKGIVTIRASGFVNEDRAKNIRLLDTSQRPAYLLIMIQQWLTLVLNFVVTIVAVLLTTLATQLRSNSGFTGASLVTLMSFGESLSGIVMWYTMLETSLGAISRLKSFSDTVRPEDQESEDIIPPKDWPQRGEIVLKGVSAGYDTEEQAGEQNLALKDIQLDVQPGEKVAICGRTGSGKSSLIALLLKLLDPTPDTSAAVHIDNAPLQRLHRSTLRRRIIAVPQDTVFLPDGSTFQANLDPFSMASAADAHAVLELVALWTFVHERGGLEAGMSPSTLSQGQRQLFSLARAVLRRRLRARSLGLGGGGGSEGGILLLDEVSSSVDRETEKKMQEVIRVEFREYTVVAVSHHLDVVMDFDRVVVMEKGEIVEVGNPRALVEEKGTRFGELWSLGGR